MSLLKCQVSDDAPAGFKSVGVPSIEGHTEYLAIEDRFLARRDGEILLPVRLIARDALHDTALVQLPVEADSGANRVWVRSDDLSETPDAPMHRREGVA